MFKPWNFQFEEFLALDESPVDAQEDLGCGEACFLNDSGNTNGIERFPLLRKHLGCPLHQTYAGMINAIQAFEGLSGPSGSQTSYHAVNLDRSVDDLGRNRNGKEKAGP